MCKIINDIGYRIVCVRVYHIYMTNYINVLKLCVISITIYIYVSKPRACITLYYYLLSSNSTQFFDPKHSNPKKKKTKTRCIRI